MKTLQDAFTVMFTGLRAQGFKQSAREVMEDGVCVHKCMYRGPNGLKCALGMLLPDDEYLSEMEGNGVNTLTELSTTFAKLCYPMKKEEMGVSLEKLEALQSIHDMCNDPAKMERAFRVFAIKNELTVPE